jgi:hypothetical protein
MDFRVFSVESKIEFGGKAAPYPKSEQFWGTLRRPWTDKYLDTWKVAANERTWLVRHVDVYPSAYVNEDGSFTINYYLEDTLDLRPDWENQSDEYNYVTTVLGFFWHDLAGGTEMKIEAYWASIYPPPQ